MKTKATIAGLVLALLLAGGVYAYGMGMGYGGGPMMGYGYQYEKNDGNIIDRFLGWFGHGRNTPGFGFSGGYGMGPGMMGGYGGYGMMGAGGCGWATGYTWQTPDGQITIEEAKALVENYIQGTDLEVKEVMDFQYNFYAQVIEKETGTGAFEVLVDKYTGAVTPEPGPNMMWNTKYGHMAWGPARENTITGDEAVELAQAYLDRTAPGLTVEDHADEFYGYYTIHVLEDGDIVGMLSVNGFTGRVWYHNWHGDYLGTELEEGH